MASRPISILREENCLLFRERDGEEKAERHSLLTMPPCGNEIISLWVCGFAKTHFFIIS